MSDVASTDRKVSEEQAHAEQATAPYKGRGNVPELDVEDAETRDPDYYDRLKAANARADAELDRDEAIAGVPQYDDEFHDRLVEGLKARVAELEKCVRGLELDLDTARARATAAERNLETMRELANRVMDKEER